MSFLNLRSSEDRMTFFVGISSVAMLAVGHAFTYGWWALLTVPLFIAFMVSIIVGLNALRDRARRKDLEREVQRAIEAAGVEPIEVTNRPPEKGAWSRLWSPRRDR